MICYDYINSYIRKTIKGSTGLLLELEEYAREHNVPVIQPEVAKLLLVIGSILKPRYILEAGTAIGYSSILLSSVLADGGRIDTIDSYQPMIEQAKANIKRAGLSDRINIIESDVEDVFKNLDREYDMIFLDAAKGQYLGLLPECLRLLRKGGVLISDNVLYKGMVANDELVVRRKKTIVQRLRKYLDEICSSDLLETSIIPIGDGVAVSWKKERKGTGGNE